MTDDKIKKDEVVVEETTAPEQNDTPVESQEEKEVKSGAKEESTEKVEETKVEEKKEKKDFAKKSFKKNDRKGNFKRERPKPEFDQKIVSLRRVTRVMAGGRRFSFSVAMLIGDKKNRVGFGTGKANDVVSAIQKATRKAKKNMYKIKLTDKKSIPYDVKGKYKASEIVIRPVFGKGLAAGGAVRLVLEYAGVKEAGAKILSRSKNHINNVRATFKALEPFMEKYTHEDKRRIMNRKSFNKNGKRNSRGDFKGKNNKKA